MNGLFKPNTFANLTARRNNLLKIYPRPSLDGKAPSAIANATVLMWSAITLKATSCSALTPYLAPESFSISLIIGINKSVSKLVGTSCNTETILSNPIPVSMFFAGSSVYVPSALWLY